MIKIAKSDVGKRVIGSIPIDGKMEVRHGELVGFSDNLPLIKYDELKIPRKAFADWLEWETK
jgi:hypothetical protein